jgi:hypothetical protein
VRIRELLRAPTIVVAAGLLATFALAWGHLVPGTCDSTSDTFLFCESNRVRETVCNCDSRRVAGCRRPMKKLLGSTNRAIASALRAKEAGDATGMMTGLEAAEKSLTKASSRLDRILARRKAADACRSKATDEMGAFTLAVQLKLGAFGSTTTSTTSTTLPDDGMTTTTATLPDGSAAPTTTTTSTTLPPGISCFGELVFYSLPTDGTEVSFSVWCNEDMTQFAIVVPDGRSITAFVGPDGFTCGQPMTSHFVCVGSLAKDVWVRGRFTLDPAATVDMGAQVFGWWGTTAVGPFVMYGPPA